MAGFYDWLSGLGNSAAGQPAMTSVGYTGGGGYSPAGDVGAGMSGLSDPGYAAMSQPGGGFLGGLFGGGSTNTDASGQIAQLLGNLLRQQLGISGQGLMANQPGFGEGVQGPVASFIHQGGAAPYTPAQGQHSLSLGGLITSMCCHPETLIHCPDGLVPIRLLHVGDLVWSKKANGQEEIERVKIVQRKAVPAGHVFANVAGSWISPTHPFPDGTLVGDRYPERAADLSNATHDIAVTGETGVYFVGHARLLMGSTLDARHRRA